MSALSFRLRRTLRPAAANALRKPIGYQVVQLIEVDFAPLLLKQISWQIDCHLRLRHYPLTVL
jgi:hypothetical protein